MATWNQWAPYSHMSRLVICVACGVIQDEVGECEGCDAELEVYNSHRSRLMDCSFCGKTWEEPKGRKLCPGCGAPLEFREVVQREDYRSVYFDAGDLRASADLFIDGGVSVSSGGWGKGHWGIEDMVCTLGLGEKGPYRVHLGVKYYAQDFAHMPDAARPDTWSMRIADGKSGYITKRKLAAAVDFVSKVSGFSPSDEYDIAYRLLIAYRKLGVQRGDIPSWIVERF